MKNPFSLAVLYAACIVPTINGMEPQKRSLSSSFAQLPTPTEELDYGSIKGSFAEGDPRAAEYRKDLKQKLSTIKSRLEKSIPRGDYIILLDEMEHINKLIDSTVQLVEQNCSEKFAKQFTEKCSQFSHFLLTSPHSPNEIIDIYNHRYSIATMQSHLLQDVQAYQAELTDPQPEKFIKIGTN